MQVVQKREGFLDRKKNGKVPYRNIKTIRYQNFITKDHKIRILYEFLV